MRKNKQKKKTRTQRKKCTLEINAHYCSFLLNFNPLTDFPNEREPDTLATTSEAPDPGAIPDKPFQFGNRDDDDDEEDVIEPSPVS